MGKWEEVCKYYTKAGFYHGFVLLVANQKWMKSLPDDLNKIVVEAGQRMARDEMERAEYRYLQLLNKFRDNGVEITELDPNEIEKMKKMWFKDRDKFIKQIGEEYYNKVENFIHPK